MPHIIVKLWPGKSEQQKSRLSAAIVEDVTNALGYGEESVSVSFQEIEPEDWTDQVFKPDILDKWGSLTKQPGYGPRPGDDRAAAKR